MRKLIGITGPSMFTSDVIYMVENFFEANPVVLYNDNEENLDYWLDRVSAVMLIGGDDLHPMTYNRSYPSKRNMRKFDLPRDRREIKIIDRAIARKLPMMGICRGHQLLGAYRKDMTLVADLCEESAIIHQPAIQEAKYITDPYSPIHKVQIMKDRTLFGETNEEGFNDLWVNSFHHQGLLYEEGHEQDPNIIGTGFVTKEKWIVELLECPEERWLSCQWHPEYDYKQQESSQMLLQYFRDEYMKSA